MVNGRHLSNINTVASAELQNGDHVIVVSAIGGAEGASAAGSMDGATRPAFDRQVFARLPSGRTIVIDLNGNDTVGHLRNIIATRIGLSPGEIYLRFGGRRRSAART